MMIIRDVIINCEGIRINMVKNLITRNYVHNLLRIFQGIIQFLTGTIFATLLRIHPQVYDYNQSIFSSFSLCFQFPSNAHHIPLFHKMRVDKYNASEGECRGER